MRNIRSLIIVLALMVAIPCMMPYHGVSPLSVNVAAVAALSQMLGRVLIATICSLIVLAASYVNSKIAVEA